MKLLVAMVFLAIFASLGSALFFVMRGDRRPPEERRKSSRVMRALALGVALSIVLFLAILVGWKLGYIQPTGIPPGR